MKKFLCVDNQKDLVTALNDLNKQVIIIDCLLIDNLGLTLLKETINYYNKSNHVVILNVEKSLPYLIFAIENNFKFIITTFKNLDINNYKELAKNNSCKIFNFTDNIFKC